MKKPAPKQRKLSYDYHECEKYVAHKLGVKDLRNFAGTTFGTGKKSDKYPYQDFWHFMCDYNNSVHNGSFVTIPSDTENYPGGYQYEDWQKKIIETFNKEFGVETEYWVEW